ncbi:MAG: ylbJ [Sporomusa sp.]|nr:ylbJ [Sporomusa sp.]
MRIWSSGRRYRSRLLAYCMAFCTVFITVAMVTYPKEAFDSAIMGLNLWWNVVFPALLPFFIYGNRCRSLHRCFARTTNEAYI